jgi:hypothetical protein
VILALVLAGSPVVYAQSGVSGSFEAESANSTTPLSKAQAKAALLPESAKKIRADLLERLLETESNEYVVAL